MDNKKIGVFISTLRKSKNMTQQELADKLGVTNKAISKWETGEGYPEITIIPELSSELEVTVDELLSANLKEPSDTYIALILPIHKRYNEIIRFMNLNAIALAFILIGLGAFVYFHTWSWHLAFVGFIIMFIMSISSIFILFSAYNGIKRIKLDNPNNKYPNEISSMENKLRQMFLLRLTLVIIFIGATIPFIPSALAISSLASFAYFMWLIVSMIITLIILFVIYRNVKSEDNQ